jgi:hypothetical protein
MQEIDTILAISSIPEELLLILAALGEPATAKETRREGGNVLRCIPRLLEAGGEAGKKSV